MSEVMTLHIDRQHMSPTSSCAVHNVDGLCPAPLPTPQQAGTGTAAAATLECTWAGEARREARGERKEESERKEEEREHFTHVGRIEADY